MTSVVSGFGRIMTYAFNGLDMSSAANDVIVVQQRDGTLHSSPFNVRFGKLKVLRPQDKVVSIEVNGVMTRAVMKINSEGVAFWLEPTTHVEGRPESPIASPGLSQQQPSSPQAEVPNMVLPTTKDPLQSTSVLIASTAELKESVAKLRRETDESSALQPLEDIGPANAELAEVLGTMQDGGHQDPQAVLREPATAPLEAFTQEMSEHQREKYTELLRSIEESVKNEDGQLHGLTLSKLASYEDLTMGASEPTPQTLANPSAPPSFGIAITDSEARLHIASPPHDVDVDRNSTCATDDGDFEEGTEDEEDGDVHSSTGTSHHEAPVIYFKPTTTPITADIEKLGLVPGHNRVRYMTHTSLHGRVVVESSIYLWSSDTKIVVSDIDGTVTKSDVWGHILPMIGRDWTHAGICSLYSKVSRNGYQFVYLTARSMSQQEQTSRFLWSIEQDGMTLPRGPVLTAPDRFFTALTQEVSKKAHEFKIACLKGIQRAFPKNSKPFYAGFGNRIGDVISYTATQIPKHKIFIIDTNSTLHVCRVKQSYKNLAHLVDVTFPPLKPTTLVSCPRGSSVNDGVNSPQGRSSTVSSASSSPTLASQGAGSPNFVSTVLPPSSTLSVSTATTHDDEGMDADFNSFNFWRVPPEELVAQVPVKNVSSTNTKLKPPSSPARANPNKQHAHPLLVDTSHVHAPAVVDETSAADPTRQKESKGWLRGWFGHQNHGAQQTSPQSAKVPPSGTSFKK